MLSSALPALYLPHGGGGDVKTQQNFRSQGRKTCICSQAAVILDPSLYPSKLEISCNEIQEIFPTVAMFLSPQIKVYICRRN